MSFNRIVFPDREYATRAAELIADASPAEGSLVLTGGTTAEKVYAALGKRDVRWDRLEVLFSDERCVPPGDPASNFGMADRLLFQAAKPKTVHRMRGEDSPPDAAAQYSSEIGPLVEDGFDLLLLGMGADAHICAMFPGSTALDEQSKLCVAVDRPDGMKGLTLTPPAVLSAKKVLLIVTGHGKAATVARVVAGGDGVASAPARLLADHPDATFVLDESANSDLH